MSNSRRCMNCGIILESEGIVFTQGKDDLSWVNIEEVESKKCIGCENEYYHWTGFNFNNLISE